MKFSIILAVDEKNWIWKDNSLAWNLSADMKYFKKITSDTTDLVKMNAVVMWRKTWESIPSKYKPLPNRINCILSRSLKDSDDRKDDFVLHYNDFDHCLDELSKKENVEEVFLIWWGSLYNQFINHEDIDKIYITKVKWDYNCDVFFDWIPDNFKIESYTDTRKENRTEYSFWVYKKPR